MIFLFLLMREEIIQNKGFKLEGNMKTKKEIVKILMENLCYAYCDNCGNDMDENLCGDCHRKYQNWKLSRTAAEKIADEILK